MSLRESIRKRPILSASAVALLVVGATGAYRLSATQDVQEGTKSAVENALVEKPGEVEGAKKSEPELMEEKIWRPNTAKRSAPKEPDAPIVPPPDLDSMSNRDLAVQLRNGNAEALRFLDMRFYAPDSGKDVKQSFLELGFSDAEFEAAQNAIVVIDGWEVIHSKSGSASFENEGRKIPISDVAMNQIYQAVRRDEGSFQNPLFRKLVPEDELYDIVSNLISMYSFNEGDRYADRVADLQRILGTLKPGSGE
jgi:hypothetical protein